MCVCVCVCVCVFVFCCLGGGVFLFCCLGGWAGGRVLVFCCLGGGRVFCLLFGRGTCFFLLFRRWRVCFCSLGVVWAGDVFFFFAVWAVCMIFFAVWAEWRGEGSVFFLLFGWGAFCFCCLGGVVFFVAVWAGDGVHSLTGLPGSCLRDPTTKKTKQQKKHGFRVEEGLQVHKGFVLQYEKFVLLSGLPECFEKAHYKTTKGYPLQFSLDIRMLTWTIFEMPWALNQLQANKQLCISAFHQPPSSAGTWPGRPQRFEFRV